MLLPLIAHKITVPKALSVYAVLRCLHFPESDRDCYLIPTTGLELPTIDKVVYTRMYRVGWNVYDGLKSYSTLTAAHRAAEAHASIINPSRFVKKSVIVVRATIPEHSKMYTPALRLKSFVDGKVTESISNALEYHDIRYHTFKI